MSMSNSHQSVQKEEDEEEDYMSEAFLNSLVANNDSKPKKESMTYSQRRRQLERQHLANLPKPLKEREREAREEGLEKEIGEENKGMAMLLKMGFKKGGTLGASKQLSENQTSSATSSSPVSAEATLTGGRQDALRAPIAIQMKHGRSGLGMDTLKKQQEEEEVTREQKRAREIYDENYRGKNGETFEYNKRHRQLLAAQAICMQLDVKKAAKDGQEKHEHALTSEEEHEKDTGHTRIRRMGRSNSFWWISDSVPDDLVGTAMMGKAASTPASTMDRQKFDLSDKEDDELEVKEVKRVRLSTPDSIEKPTAQDEEEAKWGEKPWYSELSTVEKLNHVVEYLRQEHFYCFWCAAQYYSIEDLNENCPGASEDDH
ncbi:G patch domain-containing protein 11 [Podila epigama]|nr:G patch domain-containing protein 11 [Podila epigama]